MNDLNDIKSYYNERGKKIRNNLIHKINNLNKFLFLFLLI